MYEDAARTPGKYGRRAALIPAGLRELGCYANGPLPQPPATAPAPQVTDWGMLDNDTLGDCGVAGLEHGFMAAAAEAGLQETFPDAAQAGNYYLGYTGGQDNGVVLSQYLAYVRQNGYFSHTVTAFAPIAVQDVPTLQTVIWLYDFAYTGINVTQAMEEAFADGQPWTLDTAQGDIIGGHCIPIVGYDSQYLYAVTWGQIQKIEYSAWHAIASEAWAVITGELAAGDGHGIDLAALSADLDKLDIPTPSAATHPGVLAELAGLIRDVAASAEKDVTALITFLATHGL